MADSLPTPDPDLPMPTEVPEFAEPPELRVSTKTGDTFSPRYEQGRVWTSSRITADEAGHTDVVWAYFNRFRIEELEVEHEEWRVVEGTSEFRTRELDDGMCVREQQVVEERHTFRYVMVSQFYEQWQIDTNLETYYETLLGPAAAGGATALSTAGLIGNMAWDGAEAAIRTGATATTTGTMAGAAGGSMAAAGGTAAVMAVLVGTFLGTTAVMRAVKNEVEVISKGWLPIGKFRTDEAATGEKRTVWRQQGEPYRCPDRVAPPPPLWRRWWFWLLLFGLLAVAISLVIALSAGADDAAVDEPGDDPPSADAAEPVAFGPIETTCSSITHSPAAGSPESPSWFVVAAVLRAVSGAVATAGDAAIASVPGTDAERVETAVLDNGAVVFVVPISSYGTYAVDSIEVDAGDGALLVPGALPTVDVSSDEQPVQCTGPDADALRAATEAAVADQ